MRSATRVLLVIAGFTMLSACVSVPPPQKEKADVTPASVSTFDPSTIPPEVKKDAMEEIKKLIEDLNQIIRHKDYSAWKEYLTPEYIALYSDPQTLAEISNATVLKRQNIVLSSLEDYFLYVVYPSRQSVRIDDIEFTSPSQVKAVTVAPSSDRQVYYYLEKIGESWKIGTGR